MNSYLYVVLGLLIAEYLLHLGIDLVNLRYVKTSIPDEFKDWYNELKYAESQQYLIDTTRFELIQSSIQTPLLIGFILFGGFQWADDLARSAGGGLICTGLVFTGILVLFAHVFQLPFRIYNTFVLEAKYGFNLTKPLTFIVDVFKGLLLTVLIGGPVFAGLLWFFSRAGQVAWIYSWIAVILIQFLLIYIAPVFIMPLFNTFSPLEEGDLKKSISEYAKKEGFSLMGIFKMDGSRRSTKSNAYFTGFGRWRRIVLFDTLIAKHTIDELISILAHEVGHYQLRHIQKTLIASVLSTGFMFYILSLFITRVNLYAAFGLEMNLVGGYAPIYAGFVFFGFLYTPISMGVGLAQKILSRKHEFEADEFAVQTYGNPDAMVDALKKLSVDNLSNLSPHPIKVFLEYSHPPVLERILSIRKLQTM